MKAYSAYSNYVVTPQRKKIWSPPPHSNHSEHTLEYRPICVLASSNNVSKLAKSLVSTSQIVYEIQHSTYAYCLPMEWYKRIVQHILILAFFKVEHNGSLPIITLQINYIITKMVIGNVNYVVTFFTILNLTYIHSTPSFLSLIATIMKPCNDNTIYPLWPITKFTHPRSFICRPR